MPQKMRKLLESSDLGVFTPYFATRGFFLGSANTLNPTGISSSAPRTPTIVTGGVGDGTNFAKITKIRGLRYERGRGGALQLELAQSGFTESNLLGADGYLAYLIPAWNRQTLTGSPVDSATGTFTKNPVLYQQTTQGLAGSRANQTWTFSVCLGLTDPDATTTANVTIGISLADGSEEATAVVSVDKRWRRGSVTKTFSASPTSNDIRVRIQLPTDAVPIAVSHAQLEQASSASSYQVGTPSVPVTSPSDPWVEGSGPANYLTHGGLNAFVSGNPVGWSLTGSGTVGTFEEQTGNQQFGAEGSTYTACKVTRTTAGNLAMATTANNVPKDRWYTVSVALRGTTTVTGGVRIRVKNASQGVYLQADGSWGATAVDVRSCNLVASYRGFDVSFLTTGSGFTDLDDYDVEVWFTGLANGQICYVDNCRFIGPYVTFGGTASKNKLRNTRYPYRDEWFAPVREAGGLAHAVNVTRPPEGRIPGLGRAPGGAELSIARTGTLLSDGTVYVRPYDTIGQKAHGIHLDAAATRSMWRYHAVGMPSPITGKSYLFSIWARLKRGSAGVQQRLAISGAAGGTPLETFYSPYQRLSEQWRRYWFRAYLSVVTPDAIRTLVEWTADGGVAAEVEVYGAQLEHIGGSSTYRVPERYVSNDGNAGPTGDLWLNYCSHSNGFASNWFVNTGMTMTADQGYVPQEYFEVRHGVRPWSLGFSVDDPQTYGGLDTDPEIFRTSGLRLNSSRIPTFQGMDWQYPAEGYPGAPSMEATGAYAYNGFEATLQSAGTDGGSELLGNAGYLDWWREFVRDGGFEFGSATGWSTSTAGGTVSFVGTPRTGNGSLTLTRTTSGTLNAFRTLATQYGDKFDPGLYYRLKGAVRVSAALGSYVNVPWVEIKNTTTGKAFNGSTMAWESGVRNALSHVPVDRFGSYVEFDLLFQVDPTFGASDSYQIVLSHAPSDLVTISYDDVEVRGPYDSSGNVVKVFGWTLAGSSVSEIVAATEGEPNVWVDHERGSDTELGWPESYQGVSMTGVHYPNEPTRRLTKTLTLAVGWHTLLCRARGFFGGRRMFMDLKRTSDGQWLQSDGLSMAASWAGMSHEARLIGSLTGVHSLCAFHFYVSGGGTHELSLYTYAMGVGEYGTFSNAELWTEGGWLYPAQDRPESWSGSQLNIQGCFPAFRGVVTEVSADESILELKIEDYLTALTQPLPIRTTRAECQHLFRRATRQDFQGEGGCGYVSTTTATATSSGTTHTVASTSLLEAGRRIFDRAGTVLTINTILSGTQFTTDVAGAGFQNGDAVAYADCRRVLRDCEKRGRTHRYSGFPGVAFLQGLAGVDEKYTSIGPDQTWVGPRGRVITISSEAQAFRMARDFLGSVSLEGEAAAERKTIFDEQALPLAYGRVTLRAKPVERHEVDLSSLSTGWAQPVVFYALCEGPIDSIRRVLTKDGPMEHTVFPGTGETSRWTQAVYIRKGDVGVDDWETLAEWDADRTTQSRAQNRSFRTNTMSAYSETAYLEVVLPTTGPLASDDPAKVPDLYVDLKASQVQIFDEVGSPVGSRVWSQNPAWIAVDIMLRAGCPKALINFPSVIEAAAYFDELISSDEGRTFARQAGTNTKIVPLDSVAGLAPEMTATFKGSTVTIDYVDPTRGAVVLRDSVASFAIGDVFQATPRRFTANVAFTRSMKVRDALAQVLSGARAEFVLLGEQYQLWVDKAVANVTTFSTITTGGGRGVVKGYVKGSSRASYRTSYNGVEVQHPIGGMTLGASRTVRFADAAMGGNDFPNFARFDMPACETGDQALRAALPLYAKLGRVDNQPFEFTTGPAAFVNHVGDWVDIDGNAAKRGRVVFWEIDDRYQVRIGVQPELTSVQFDGWGEAVSPYDDNPWGFGLREAGVGLAAPAVTLTVTKNQGSILEASVGLSGYLQGPGANAGNVIDIGGYLELHASTTSGFTPTLGYSGLSSTLLQRIDSTARKFSVVLADALLDVPIYLKAVWIVPSGRNVISAQVATTVYQTTKDTTDPTAGSSGASGNMVYGGDFDDAVQALGLTDGKGAWLTDAIPTWGTFTKPTSNAGPVTLLTDGDEDSTIAWNNPGNARDSNGATDADGTGTNTYSSGTLTFKETATHQWYGGMSGTKDVRVRFVGRRDATTNQGAVLLYYSTDGGSSWVQFASFTSTTEGSYYSATLPAVNLSNLRFGIKAQGGAGGPLFSGGKACKGYLDEVGYEELTSSTNGIVANDIGELKGDGTNYGNLKRRFPGRAPADSVTVFVSGKQACVRLRLKKKNSGDTLDSNPVVVRIFDENSTNVWTLLTVPSSAITSQWKDFSFVVTFGSNVAGKLWIEARTKNTKAIECDKLGCVHGDRLEKWQPSPEEQADGFFGDWTRGDASGWTEGPWTGDPRESTPF